MKEFAKRYYRSMRVSCAASAGKCFNYSPFDMYQVDSMFFGDTNGIGNRVDVESGFEEDTVDFFKYYIDKAIANDALLCIGIHSGNIVEFNRQADLAAICDYIASKIADGQLKNMTYNDALNHIGNVVDTDTFKVGAEIYRKGFNVYTLTDPIASYPAGISYTPIQTAHALTHGFPEGVGGTLETHNILNAGWIYQLYTIAQKRISVFGEMIIPGATLYYLEEALRLHF